MMKAWHRYRQMFEEVEERICRAKKTSPSRLTPRLCLPQLVIFNSLSWPRQEWIQARGQWKQVAVPSMGYQAVDLSENGSFPTMTATQHILENEILRVTFGENGTITSLFDKEFSREALQEGQPANCLALYRDPGDAWDFPLDYANQAPQPLQLVSAKAAVEGPRATLVQTYQIGHSELVQEITLTAGSRRVDFHTTRPLA